MNSQHSYVDRNYYGIISYSCEMAGVTVPRFRAFPPQSSTSFCLTSKVIAEKNFELTEYSKRKLIIQFSICE